MSDSDTQGEAKIAPLTKRKKFTCAGCDANFYTKFLLDLHRVTRCPKLPHPCRQCDLRFANLASHKSHMKIHSVPSAAKKQAAKIQTQNTRVTIGRRQKKNSDVNKPQSEEGSNSPIDLRVDKNQRSQVLKEEALDFINRQKIRAKEKKSAKKERRNSSARKDDEFVTCEVCSLTFSGIKKLERHVRVHGVKKAYQCERCNMGFYWKSNFNRHVRTQCPGQATIYVCVSCGRQFDRKATLLRHRQTRHPEEEARLDKMETDKSTSQVEEGNSSGDVDDGNEPEDNPVEDDANNHRRKRRVSSKGVMHRCDVCQMPFRWKCDLNRHRITHSDIKAYPCDQCDLGFNWKSNLTRHKRKIHCGNELVHQCDWCGEGFVKEFHLEKHMTMYCAKKPSMPSKEFTKNQVEQGHISEEPIHDEVAGEKQTAEEQMHKEVVQIEENHEDLHSTVNPNVNIVYLHVCQSSGSVYNIEKSCENITPESCETEQIEDEVYVPVKKKRRAHNPKNEKFICSHCGRVFARKTCYVQHERSHSKQTIKCRWCDKFFNRLVLLEKHERFFHFHELNDCVPCDVCDSEFETQAQLMEHMKSQHSNPDEEEIFEEVQRKGLEDIRYKCDSCDLTFSQRSSLVIHQKVHYKCDKCDLKFIHKVTYERHLERVHFTDRGSAPTAKRIRKNVDTHAYNTRFRLERAEIVVVEDEDEDDDSAHSSDEDKSIPKLKPQSAFEMRSADLEQSMSEQIGTITVNDRNSACNESISENDEVDANNVKQENETKKDIQVKQIFAKGVTSRKHINAYKSDSINEFLKSFKKNNNDRNNSNNSPPLLTSEKPLDNTVNTENEDITCGAENIYPDFKELKENKVKNGKCRSRLSSEEIVISAGLANFHIGYSDINIDQDSQIMASDDFSTESAAGDGKKSYTKQGTYIFQDIITVESSEPSGGEDIELRDKQPTEDIPSSKDGKNETSDCERDLLSSGGTYEKVLDATNVRKDIDRNQEILQKSNDLKTDINVTVKNNNYEDIVPRNHENSILRFHANEGEGRAHIVRLREKNGCMKTNLRRNTSYRLVCQSSASTSEIIEEKAPISENFIGEASNMNKSKDVDNQDVSEDKPLESELVSNNQTLSEASKLTDPNTEEVQVIEFGTPRLELENGKVTKSNMKQNTNIPNLDSNAESQCTPDFNSSYPRDNEPVQNQKNQSISTSVEETNTLIDEIQIDKDNDDEFCTNGKDGACAMHADYRDCIRGICTDNDDCIKNIQDDTDCIDSIDEVQVSNNQNNCFISTIKSNNCFANVTAETSKDRHGSFVVPFDYHYKRLDNNQNLFHEAVINKSNQNNNLNNSNTSCLSNIDTFRDSKLNAGLSDHLQNQQSENHNLNEPVERNDLIHFHANNAINKNNAHCMYDSVPHDKALNLSSDGRHIIKPPVWNEVFNRNPDNAFSVIKEPNFQLQYQSNSEQNNTGPLTEQNHQGKPMILNRPFSHYQNENQLHAWEEAQLHQPTHRNFVAADASTRPEEPPFYNRANQWSQNHPRFQQHENFQPSYGNDIDEESIRYAVQTVQAIIQSEKPSQDSAQEFPGQILDYRPAQETYVQTQEMNRYQNFQVPDYHRDSVVPQVQEIVRYQTPVLQVPVQIGEQYGGREGYVNGYRTFQHFKDSMHQGNVYYGVHNAETPLGFTYGGRNAEIHAPTRPKTATDQFPVQYNSHFAPHSDPRATRPFRERHFEEGCYAPKPYLDLVPVPYTDQFQYPYERSVNFSNQLAPYERVEVTETVYTNLELASYEKLAHRPGDPGVQRGLYVSAPDSFPVRSQSVIRCPSENPKSKYLYQDVKNLRQFESQSLVSSSFEPQSQPRRNPIPMRLPRGAKRSILVDPRGRKRARKSRIRPIAIAPRKPRRKRNDVLNREQPKTANPSLQVKKSRQNPTSDSQSTSDFKISEKSLECDKCDQAFLLQIDLLRHQFADHDSNRLLPC